MKSKKRKEGKKTRGIARRIENEVTKKGEECTEERTQDESSELEETYLRVRQRDGRGKRQRNKTGVREFGDLKEKLLRRHQRTDEETSQKEQRECMMGLTSRMKIAEGICWLESDRFMRLSEREEPKFGRSEVALNTDVEYTSAYAVKGMLSFGSMRDYRANVRGGVVNGRNLRERRAIYTACWRPCHS